MSLTGQREPYKGAVNPEAHCVIRVLEETTGSGRQLDMASGHICFSDQPSPKELHAYTSHTLTHTRAFFYPAHSLPCYMCLCMLTHVFLTHICFPECVQHTWFAHTYIHVFLPTDTKYFSPFDTHAHALSHKHFSPRSVSCTASSSQTSF